MGRIKKAFIMVILSVVFMAVVPAQPAYADEGDIHTVTYNLTGVTASPGEAEVIEGSGLDVVFTADAGYTLPDSISVQMAGEELSGYVYEGGNLVISDVRGDLVITVNGVPATDSSTGDSTGTETGDSDAYNISYDLYKVMASKREGNVKAGTKYSVKLKAESGFRLDPLNVAVKVNGDYVASGYSYNEGLLEIDSVNGDIVIEAIAVQKASAKEPDDDEPASSKKPKNSKTTGISSTTAPAGKTTGGSSKNSSSKSAQALSGSGTSVRNYSTGSYRAPRTGDYKTDIRYYGALALVLIGAGFVIAGKRYKKDE